MLTLDCQSRDSTLVSLASAYAVPEEVITAFLQDFDIDLHYEQNDPMHPGDRELRLVFEGRLGRQAAPLDRVCWFHLTRAHSKADFASGIQPLSVSLQYVWQTVLDVFRNTPHEKRLIEFQRTGVPEFHYQLKAHDPIHAGPYAMLVRESADRSSEIGNHDYLGLPEIMEDICNGYQATYDESIQDQLAAALSPTIVKFWSTKRLGIDCIEAALYYLYLTTHGRKMTLYANTCFDGENEAIPAEQIISAEIIGTYAAVPSAPTGPLL